MTTITPKSLLTPFATFALAAMLFVAGCANSLTGPDAAPADDETVQARPFTAEQADHNNGEGATTYGAGHNHAPDEDDD